ncbi:MAG: SHOCT domain-containing protein [Patescibacteria group bacterium]
MMYYYDSFFPFHMFGFGFVWMVLFWGLIIYGLVVVSRKSSLWHDNKKSSALDILKERYAKGEITKHQFEEMKKDIHG